MNEVIGETYSVAANNTPVRGCTVAYKHQQTAGAPTRGTHIKYKYSCSVL